ncbi:MAG: 4Fe-4S binding protein, partial [Eubacteriales bacterium]|nr:4Fe-4S binding protein [Eubacteriales bacterium]
TGVQALIFRAPCICVAPPEPPWGVGDGCVGCKKCIRELGCPAIVFADGKAAIEPSLCYGCGLCAQICPVWAIEGGKE